MRFNRSIGLVPLGLAVALASCGDSGGAIDAGDGSVVCADARGCDDGLFCNGPERCEGGVCVAGAAPCLEGQRCDEVAETCESDCAMAPDADGDGVVAVGCGGLDCNDADPNVSPAATEVCDVAGVDEDCDPSTFGSDGDTDGDGFTDAACCNGDRCGDDCDDRAAGVHPGEAEECDGVDQDCDGATDEGVMATFVRDMDGDGFSDVSVDADRVEACTAPAGYAARGGDCDDMNASTHPGAFDRCDPEEVDDDCSGTPNDPPGGCACTSGSSRTCPLPGACAASSQNCVSGLWGGCGIGPTEDECGNDRDEDCDGAVDEGCSCSEPFRVCGSDTGRCSRGTQECTGDGWGVCMGAIGGEPEICNAVDDDCDGEVDEGVAVICYVDGDSDGFAVSTAPPTPNCGSVCPENWTDRAPVDVASQDCDGSDARAFPGQTEYFGRPRNSEGGNDFDCDGVLEAFAPFPPGTDACEAGPGGECVFDLFWDTDPSGCGTEVDQVHCAVDRGACTEVFRCAGGVDGCPLMACR